MVKVELDTFNPANGRVTRQTLFVTDTVDRAKEILAKDGSVPLRPAMWTQWDDGTHTATKVSVPCRYMISEVEYRK